MSDVALRMEHVYKKFRKGEIYNSLRDLLPALTGQMFRQQELNENDKREFWALQDLSFEVNRGQSFGIIGRNGAGKSTTLKILSRIMKPTKGGIVVHGRLSALIEVTAGFHHDLTGRENIFLYGTIMGMTRREIESKLDQIIAFSGIEEFIDTPVKRYSSGMYARLGFSVAAHVAPDVLIVDEVLSVGDMLFQQKCIERMREVLRNGVAVVFVSHNLKAVAEFCQRCLLLEKGRAVVTGPASEVISAYLHRDSQRNNGGADSAAARITSVKVRNENGESTRFQSGEKVWVDIEVTARAPCEKLSVTFYILDDNFRHVFDSSLERLGQGNFALDEGEVFSCTFELNLNLATGIFHPSVLLYRYDTETEYDQRAPATTIYISSPEDVRGPVHCFPKVVRKQILRKSEEEVATKVPDMQGDDQLARCKRGIVS